MGTAMRNHMLITAVITSVLFFISPVHALAPFIYYFLHDMVHQPINEYRAGVDINWMTHYD